MSGRWVDLDGAWVRARITATRRLLARLAGFNSATAERAVLEHEFAVVCASLELLIDELDRHALARPGGVR